MCGFVYVCVKCVSVCSLLNFVVHKGYFLEHVFVKIVVQRRKLVTPVSNFPKIKYIISVPVKISELLSKNLKLSCFFYEQSQI